MAMYSEKEAKHKYTVVTGCRAFNFCSNVTFFMAQL